MRNNVKKKDVKDKPENKVDHCWTFLPTHLASIFPSLRGVSILDNSESIKHSMLVFKISQLAINVKLILIQVAIIFWQYLTAALPVDKKWKEPCQRVETVHQKLPVTLLDVNV